MSWQPRIGRPSDYGVPQPLFPSQFSPIALRAPLTRRVSPVWMTGLTDVFRQIAKSNRRNSRRVHLSVFFMMLHLVSRDMLVTWRLCTFYPNSLLQKSVSWLSFSGVQAIMQMLAVVISIILWNILIRSGNYLLMHHTWLERRRAKAGSILAGFNNFF